MHPIRSHASRSKSAEDDGPIDVQQDPMLDVPAHRPGERHALDVAAHTRQLGDAVGVVDPRDLLLDDRSLVELLGHVVGGGADELHATRVCLGVRAGAP